MAKIKEVKKEEPKVEDTVSVEMSPEQFDAFTKHEAEKLDKEEKEAKAAAAPKNTVLLHLANSHRINGKLYGPGPTKVPEGISGQIAHADNASIEQELGLMKDRGRVMNLTQALHGGARILPQAK